VPPFRAAQIVGARFVFFVSLAHVKDRLKQCDGVFESGLGNRRQIGQIVGKRLVSRLIRGCLGDQTADSSRNFVEQRFCRRGR